MEKHETYKPDRFLELHFEDLENVPEEHMLEVLEIITNEKLSSRYMWETDLQWIPPHLHKHFKAIGE